MKEKNCFLILACIFFVLGCRGQTNRIIRPELVATFNLGTTDFFEKDLAYVKRILDNEMYTLQMYSFLPSAIYLVEDQIIIYDKMSCNVIVHNCKTGVNQSIQEINSVLKQYKSNDKQNIELIDVAASKLLFYNMMNKECLLVDLTKRSLECKFYAESPFSVDLNGGLKVYGYRKNYKLDDCTVSPIGLSKRLPVNENRSFIKFNGNLFYQNLDQNEIQKIEIMDSISKFSKTTLLDSGLGSNYSLVHVNNQYYILASNAEIGLGEFLFVSKSTLKIEQRIKIDQSILSNSLIDFYNAISDAPSPDVDDLSSYVRMTSFENRYFIFFQSRGSLLLYKFNL